VEAIILSCKSIEEIEEKRDMICDVLCYVMLYHDMT
jgi:hypothetical protein